MRASSHACFMSLALALLTLTSSRSAAVEGTRSASIPGVGGVSSLGGGGGGVSPLAGAGGGEALPLRVRGAMFVEECGFKVGGMKGRSRVVRKPGERRRCDARSLRGRIRGAVEGSYGRRGGCGERKRAGRDGKRRETRRRYTHRSGQTRSPSRATWPGAWPLRAIVRAWFALEQSGLV